MQYLIQALRERQGTRPLRQFAAELDLHFANLGKVLAGKRGLSTSEAKKILAVYPELRAAVMASLLDEDIESREAPQQSAETPEEHRRRLREAVDKAQAYREHKR